MLPQSIAHVCSPNPPEFCAILRSKLGMGRVMVEKSVTASSMFRRCFEYIDHGQVSSARIPRVNPIFFQDGCSFGMHETRRFLTQNDEPRFNRYEPGCLRSESRELSDSSGVLSKEISVSADAGSIITENTNLGRGKGETLCPFQECPMGEN